MKPAIRVDNLSKSYRLGSRSTSSYRTLRDTISESAAGAWHGLRRRLGGTSNGTDNGKAKDNAFWALKDVSFEVQPGEVVGIIGRNGAGKSTLLKILSRIVEPSGGRCEVRGRMASLLEVGTGFHPELTGRENIYMNGSILGMSRKEIDRKFDEIVAFSEIEQFLDTPVKRYSSGMYVRLAFAVAAHLDPDILIVDEVLAVGDAAFQKKCLGQISESVRAGRTVLMVSHNMGVIQHLCREIVLMQRGEVVYAGSAAEGINLYLAEAQAAVQSDVDLTRHDSRRKGCLPILRRVRFRNKDGKVVNCVRVGEPLQIEFEVDTPYPLSEPQFGIGFDDVSGNRACSCCTYLSSSQVNRISKNATVICRIDEVRLAPGRYLLSLSAGTVGNTLLDALDQAVSIEVETSDYYRNGRLPTADLGVFVSRSDWELT